MNAQQFDLIHESLNDALTDAVRAMGGSKKVASALWPSKPLDQAKNWLNDCLNPHRPEKLSLSEIMFLLRGAREIGYHGAMNYIAQECGYRIEPVEAQDEKERLIREFNESTRALAKIAERIERLANVPVKPRAVA
jgi:hypothetical protein